MKARRLVALALVLALMPGCYMTRVSSGFGTQGTPEKRTSWCFFWGWAGDDIPANCPQGLSRVDIYTNPFGQLLALLTLGLVYPQTVRYWPMPKPEPEPQWGPPPPGWAPQQQQQVAQQQGPVVVLGGGGGGGGVVAQGTRPCGSCGIEVQASARFCYACGDPVAIPGTRNFCESCGEKVDGAAFCQRCGTRR